MGLDSLQCAHVSPVLGSPVLDQHAGMSGGAGSPSQTCWQSSPQCSPGGWCPLLRGYVAGSWSAWCAPGPRVLFCRAAFQPLLVLGVIPPQTQDVWGVGGKGSVQTSPCGWCWGWCPMPHSGRAPLRAEKCHSPCLLPRLSVQEVSLTNERIPTFCKSSPWIIFSMST